MNVLKTAIVGLTLISGTTLARADVIADWNNTAMDVMKAVNVAGNPWARSQLGAEPLLTLHPGASDRPRRLGRGSGSIGSP